MLPGRILIYLVLVVFSNTTFSDEALSRVEAGDLSRNFGSVARGTVVSESFTLRNKGTAPLIIERMDFRVHGMSARVRQTIEPGGSAELVLSWDTSQFSREVEGEAVISINDPERPELLITLTGFVVSPIDILPYPAVYLSQYQGEQAAQSLSLQNNQDHPIALTGYESSSDIFSVEIEAAKPGSLFNLTIAAKPDAPIGRWRERLFVHTDDPDHRRFAIEVNILVKPDVFVSIETLDFGRLSLRRLKGDPAVLDLVKQLFMVTRRGGEMNITAMKSDLPFITLSRDPEKSAPSFQVEAGLDLKSLKVGDYHGTVILETDDSEFSELKLPVRIVITE
jgi:hypothetical protein